jgi:hypothetical protein
MIWAILALLGVPLWLCAFGILVLVFRNRRLRKRAADIPLRLRVDANGRWHRGHGLWVHDVLGFRGSPAAWHEALLWASSGTARELTPEEAHKFRRLDQPVAVSFTVVDGPAFDAITNQQHRSLLPGPFQQRRPQIQSKQ